MKKNEIEAGYWGDCCSEVAFGEFCKQRMYMREMGLVPVGGEIDMQEKSVLDIGGGPMSMLLRCRNVRGTVVDPIGWPSVVKHRYTCYGIELFQIEGEHANMLFRQGHTEPVYDEVWIYNCLQHVNDPAKVLENAKSLGRLIRIFEWLNTGSDVCHPHNLTTELLTKWLEGTKMESISIRRQTEFGCNCDAFAGVFKCAS